MEKQPTLSSILKNKYTKRGAIISLGLLVVFTGPEFVQERRNVGNIKSGRLEYTQRGGRIDRGHGDPGGVRHLLNRVNNPKDTLDDSCYGFVYYGQHQRLRGQKFGVEKKYLVKKDMTEQEKLSVALAILLEVSLEFEEYQTSTDWITGSSYNEADGFSNVLGLYIAAKLCTKEQILSLLDPVGIDSSLAMYDTRKIGKNKNPGTIIKYASTGDIILAPYPFPFDQIQPAQKGVLFKDFQ